MGWLNQVFGIDKPIIGMAHLGALPGDPGYLSVSGAGSLVATLVGDVEALQRGGVDGIMFSNESSQPWMIKQDPVTAVAMAAILGRIRSRIRLPFGVHAIWDPEATISLAVATGASFAWEIFTGTYAGDFGVWDTDVGAALRYRRMLHAEHIRLFFEIVPEASVYVGRRQFEDVVRSVVSNCRPDALCVAGLKPGAPPSLGLVGLTKRMAPDIPVFVTTGMRIDNVDEYMRVADGAVVGSALKRNSDLWNPVDPGRVMALVERARGVGQTRELHSSGT